ENEDQLTSRNYDSWQDRNSTGNSQTGHSSCEDQDTVKHVVKGRDAESGGLKFGGFSFPSPSSTSNAIERDDILASWRRKSNESSPVLSSRSAHSTTSTYSNYELAERELQKRDIEENLNDPREHEETRAIDDEEATAVQEQ
ncbi:hypothetical protein KI387_000929, partial [Taxus chinensis]